MFGILLELLKLISTHSLSAAIRLDATRSSRWYGFVIPQASWQVQLTNHRPQLLLAHYFYDHSLVALSIEFGVEDSLPGSQIEFAGSDRHDYLVVNQQRLQV